LMADAVALKIVSTGRALALCGAVE
jgi:hypothetical protein